MKLDIHVHTYPKSQCSSIDPRALLSEARRIGLDGVCLTEHQSPWNREDVERLSERNGIRIFRGNEITTAQGDVLVFGLDRDIQGIITAEELHREVAEAGGFSIAAHPFRGFKVFGFGQLSLSLEQAAQKRLLRFVDAVEIRNGRVTEQENNVARQVSERLGMPGTAGSDAHELLALGTWIMDFPVDLETEADLIRELRAGNYSIASLR